MATVHGKNAAVYMQGSGSDAVLVSEANEWSIDFSFDTEPDSAFGDIWETSLRGLIRATGTVNGNFDTAQSTMFDAVLATTPRKLYVYPDRDSPTRYYYSTVWPRMSTTMPMGVGKFAMSWTNGGVLALN